MDLFLVAIVAALFITVVITIAGLLTMAGGGKTDDALSTPLMWARVGAQALTILLLVTAILAR
jgi:Hypoxia induced protein conserved region